MIVLCDHSAINDADDYIVIMIIIIMTVVLSDNGDDIKYTCTCECDENYSFQTLMLIGFLSSLKLTITVCTLNQVTQHLSIMNLL